MYNTDVPEITSWVHEQGPSGVISVVSFVLCTIRTPLSRVKGQLEDIKDYGHASSSLWGFKRSGYEYTVENSRKLYEVLEKEPEEVLDEYVKVPGLGYPKASFALQCLGLPFGCLDSHNLKRFKIPVQATKKKETYLAALEQCGNPEYLWDSWCNMIPGTPHNKSFTTGQEVSKYHVECIKCMN